jgi:hypothetical protein
MSTALQALGAIGGVRELRQVRSVFEGMRDAINDTDPLTLGMAAMMFKNIGTAAGEFAAAAPAAGTNTMSTSANRGGDSYTVTLPIYIGDEKFEEKVFTIAEGAANEVYDERGVQAVNP